jgi:hypothetical protein
MPKFDVEIQRTAYVNIEVETADAEAAENIVMQRDFALPPMERWQVLKGGDVIVRNEAGEEERETSY